MTLKGLAWVLVVRPFRYNYFMKVAIADELFTTIAASTFFAFEHKLSSKSTVSYFCNSASLSQPSSSRYRLGL